MALGLMIRLVLVERELMVWAWALLENKATDPMEMRMREMTSLQISDVGR